MDRRMKERADARTEGRTGGLTEKWKKEERTGDNGWSRRQTDGQMERHMDGLTDEWNERGTGGRKANERTDG